MSEAKIWSEAELAVDAEAAKTRFREQRVRGSLALYSEFFTAAARTFANVVDNLHTLTAEPFDPDIVVGLVRDVDTRTAFRYLAAPPISEDDLKTLAETTLTASRLVVDTEQARRLRDVVLRIVDPHRFPWVGERRQPTGDERMRAIVASSALVATRQVETARRLDAKNRQEREVKAQLHRVGLAEVDSRDIPLLDLAPKRGEYCGESRLGSTRADLAIGLFDGRVMALECKVSNSAVNSFKRVNHEAAGKARDWLAAFGKRQVVPAAVLAGVFNPDNLAAAQEDGLALFWSHRLQDLADCIESTRID